MFSRAFRLRPYSTHWRPSPPEVTTFQKATDVVWRVTVVLLLSASVALGSYSTIGLISLSAHRRLHPPSASPETPAGKDTDFVVKKE